MATIVDSYSETNNDNPIAVFAVHPSAGGDSAWGQSFTGDGQKIYSVKFYVYEIGDPGNCIVRLYAHSGTYGSSSVPTGSPLDSSSIVAAVDLPDSIALYEFTGFTGYTLVNGTKYCIVFEAYDGQWDDDPQHFVQLGLDISSPSHGGNSFRYKESAWEAFGAYDLCFYVYGVSIGQPTMKRWGGIPYMEPKGKGVW